MRIALLAPISHRVPPPGYGPWEQVVADLADGLSEKGHEITVFAAGGSMVRGKLVSVVPRPLDDWPANEPNDPRIWEEIHIAEAAVRASRGCFDVVHNHLSVHPLGFASLLPVPMLTTLHGVAWNQASHPALHRYRHLAYVSISDSERRFFPDLNYVATVHNGVRSERFPEGRGDGGYLLFAGRLAPEKGPHLAIETARGADMPLRLAGPIEEKYRSFFEEIIRPSLSEPEIEYLGALSREELTSLYRGALGLLVPLEWDEPFGLVTPEAMMTGTPVIGWKRGALPELVAEGISGFLVNDVDEATAATSRLSELDRSKCRAYAIDRFGIQRMTSGYEAVYEAMAGAGREVSR